MPSDTKIFLHDIEDGQFEICDWGDYRIGYFLAKNRSGSARNEDCVFLNGNDKSLVLGVSDGAGGHPRGRDASFAVGELISKQNFDASKSMLEVIEKANQQVVNLKAGAHCTLAMIAIFQNFMRAYSVGDSEIIYWNAQGNEIYSNIPQSTVGYQIEAGVLNQEESLDDPDRYIVDNMLGDVATRIETATQMEIKKGHTILIGSDGLFDNLSHEQLTSLVAGGVFEKSFQDLVDKCQQQEEWKKDDDISFILIRKIKV